MSNVSYADATTLPILCLVVLALMHSVTLYIQGKVESGKCYILRDMSGFAALHENILCQVIFAGTI